MLIFKDNAKGISYQSKKLWKSILRKTLVFTKCQVLKFRLSADIQIGKTNNLT